MSVLFSKSTNRPKWAKTRLVWVIEDFYEVTAFAATKAATETVPEASGIHGNQIYSPEFGDSTTGFWRMGLDPMLNDDQIRIILRRSDPRRKTVGYYTLTSPGQDGDTLVLNSPRRNCLDKSLLDSDGERVRIFKKDVVKNNVATIICEVQIYRGMVEVSSVDKIPGELGNECIILRPSEDDELHVDCKEAVGVPCPADILVAKIPAVLPLFKRKNAKQYYVVSVPNTNLLTLTHLVEYMKTDRCSPLDKEPTHVGYGSDKSCLEVDAELINLLSVAKRLEFAGLVEACVALMQSSIPPCGRLTVEQTSSSST